MCRLYHTQRLSLNNNLIGDAGVTALANACAGGAMAQLKELWLYKNKIGDAGMIKLSEACAGGTLPKCTTIILEGNPASQEAQQAVEDALQNRSK